MGLAKLQQLLRFPMWKRVRWHASNRSCCNNPRQNLRESDRLTLLSASATDSQSHDTHDMSFVNKMKQHSNSSKHSKQKYYLCDYQYEGESWCIEIPAESWEDAQARLKRIAYGRIAGEIKATFPVQFGFWVKLWVWLKNWG